MTESDVVLPITLYSTSAMNVLDVNSAMWSLIWTVSSGVAYAPLYAISHCPKTS